MRTENGPGQTTDFQMMISAILQLTIQFREEMLIDDYEKYLEKLITLSQKHLLNVL